MKNEHDRLIDRFMNGFTELHLHRFDPYYMKELKFDTGGNTNAISFTASFRNVNMYGGKNMVIEKLTFDVESTEMIGVSYYPYINIVADYDVTGNILILPLDSTGRGNLNLSEYFTIFAF